jgi:ABC-type dipeptide/oligopeptide/nickel transport system ATPase component
VIAMAVMHRPKLLIADEATSALDPASRDEILALFRKLNVELKMAILYVSHDLASVGRLCHTVGILEEGRLIECGQAAHLLRGPAAPPPFSGNCAGVARLIGIRPVDPPMAESKSRSPHNR